MFYVHIFETVLLPIVFQDVLQKISTDFSLQSFFLTSGLILCFPGIYGVGKAALHPPALAVLSHTPDGATQTIAWVGKGIVYDTGGLSIKGKVHKYLVFLLPFLTVLFSDGNCLVNVCRKPEGIYLSKHLNYGHPYGHKLPEEKTEQNSRSLLQSS